MTPPEDLHVAEPPRPDAAEVAAELTAHVQALAGPDATPRPEQVDAVTAVVRDFAGSAAVIS